MKRKETRRLDVDALLQNSYLLVVELGAGGKIEKSPELWSRCVSLIEDARRDLEEAGLSQRSAQLISHAQCGLLDERVLQSTTGELRAQWTLQPLQARFFNSHQAGESLYEEMREVLREPSPDPQVLTAFQRILALGFRGRYPDDNDPERERLLAELSARVAPLRARQLRLGRRASAFSLGARIQSSLTHGLTVALLLMTVWWGLDQVLGNLIHALSPGASLEAGE